jgi:hypothetical protein
LAAKAACGLRFESLAAGVGQRRTARSVRVVFDVIGAPPEERESLAVAVGHDPEAAAAMGAANGGRAETRPLDIEPEVGKVPKDVVESSTHQGRHILEERESRTDFVDDSGDMRP